MKTRKTHSQTDAKCNCDLRTRGRRYHKNTAKLPNLEKPRRGEADSPTLEQLVRLARACGATITCRLVPKWTKTKPVRSGWYWWQVNKAAKPRMSYLKMWPRYSAPEITFHDPEVSSDRTTTHEFNSIRGWWQGPLTVPSPLKRLPAVRSSDLVGGGKT